MKKATIWTQIIGCLLFIVLVNLSCKKDDVPENKYGRGHGEFMFYLTNDMGVGKITVFVDGVSQGTISRIHTMWLPCGDSEVNFVAGTGVHTYSAVSATNRIWQGSFEVKEGECNSIDLSQVAFTSAGSSGSTGGGGGGVSGWTGGGSSGGTGSGGSSSAGAIFWIRSDFGIGPIAVTCNGLTRTISKYSSGGAPPCGTDGFANFNFSPGKYSFTASGGSATWNGDITISAGKCEPQELICNGCGGSGGGGSGGGGGSATKYVVFYTTNCNRNPIEIYVDNSYRGTISSCYINGTPTCLDYNGGVRISIEGFHSWHAKEKNTGTTWTGSYTITKECTLIPIN